MRVGRATLALAVAGSAVSIAVGADTRPIRIGVETETIAAWRVDANPTLAAAIAALGAPTSCRKLRNFGGFATVDWRQLGLRALFGTYGAGGARPCKAVRVVRLDNARATGKAWRTGRGLRPGDSVTKLRRLYPQARLHPFVRGVSPARGWWLVVRTSRVPDFHRYPALLAEARRGRVTALVVNVQHEGD